MSVYNLVPAVPVTVIGELQTKYGASFIMDPIPYLQQEAASNSEVRNYLQTVQGYAPPSQPKVITVQNQFGGAEQPVTVKQAGPVVATQISPVEIQQVSQPIVQSLQQTAPVPYAPVIPPEKTIKETPLITPVVVESMKSQQVTAPVIAQPTQEKPYQYQAITTGEAFKQSPEYKAAETAKISYEKSSIVDKAIFHAATILSPESEKYIGSAIGSTLGVTKETPESVVKETMAKEALYKQEHPTETPIEAFGRGAVGSLQSVPVQVEASFLAGAGFTAGAAKAATLVSKAKPLLTSSISKVLGESALSYGAKAVGYTPKVVSYGLGGAYVASTSYNVGILAGEGRTSEAIGAGVAGATNFLAMGVGAKAEAKYMVSQQPKQEISQIIDLSKRKEGLETLKEAQSLWGEGGIKPKELTFKGMERLPDVMRNEPEPTLNFLRQNDIVVGGSTAQRTQIIKGTRSYAESDLDLYSKKGQSELARGFADVLKRQGVQRVDIVPGTGRVTYMGQKIAEFHPIEMLKGNIGTSVPWYVPSRFAIKETPSGIKVLDIRSQAVRKVTAGFTDVSRASKDLPDYRLIAKQFDYKETTGMKGSVGFGFGRFNEPATKPITEVVGTKLKTQSEYQIPKLQKEISYPSIKAPQTFSYSIPKTPQSIAYPFIKSPEPIGYPERSQPSYRITPIEKTVYNIPKSPITPISPIYPSGNIPSIIPPYNPPREETPIISYPGGGETPYTPPPTPEPIKYPNPPPPDIITPPYNPPKQKPDAFWDWKLPELSKTKKKKPSYTKRKVYTPTLLGLISGRTISKAPSRLSGGEIRYPVMKRRKKR